MENLKCLVFGREINGYQHQLAIQEFKKLEKDLKEMHLNMQYYMEYCQMKGYVAPQEWLENHKHF